MGYYFNPPDEIRNVARELDPSPMGYKGMYSQLEEDEILFGLFDRLDAPFKNCPFLYCEWEWEEFFSQVRRGNIVLEGLFGLPRKFLRDEEYDWAEKEQEKPDLRKGPRNIWS